MATNNSLASALPLLLIIAAAMMIIPFGIMVVAAPSLGVGFSHSAFASTDDGINWLGLGALIVLLYGGVKVTLGVVDGRLGPGNGR